jgi:sulfite oxidase
MNGKPLTPAHGAPVRALFPGILGARSVKWLNHITLQLKESSNFYQQHDYKILPPEAVDTESAAKFWAKTPAMSDMPINSIIGIPSSDSKVTRDEDGAVEVRGYALPAGMHGPVVKVEVSGDDGATWVTADLDYGGFDKPGMDTEEGRRRVRWAWCLWKATLRLDKGAKRRIVCRAADFGGNVQPRESAWNLRGVGFNAWGEAKDLDVL